MKDHNVPIPVEVRNAANEGLRLIRLGFQGGTETGYERAHQLATKTSISLEDAREIRNFFARHVHISYPGYREWVSSGRPVTKQWKQRGSMVAWLIWGGNPAYEWINSKPVIEKINAKFNTDYSALF